MGGRINTIMQTCFFGISGILPRDEAIAHIKKSIEKTYGKRGPEVVKRNWEVVDLALAHLHEIQVPNSASATRSRPPIVSEKAPDFVQKVTAVMLAGKGDLLPVSAFSIDGTWPTGTAKWEKRNLALERSKGLHPVQSVCPCLSACSNPFQSLRWSITCKFT
jgi:pyruvate-ferredoxin/flavodoxin oxidoreductase